LDHAYNDDCRCGCGDEIPYFEPDRWRVQHEDDTEVNLWSVFSQNFFNYRVTYRRGEDGEMVIDPHVDDEDGWYPARARFDDQLPLEYIWAALGELDTDRANSNRQEWEIHAYKWHDAKERENRVTPEDIGLLGEKICQALEHLEHSLSYYHNPFMGSHRLRCPISRISTSVSRRFGKHPRTTSTSNTSQIGRTLFGTTQNLHVSASELGNRRL
jgi:hypothetical protein